ncbi:hypothetical protein K435DRAFT_797027 [Dendrothele bispora CBS 962.96]|uniref:Uncharacterized protein n=1 Tax=Dendrothele bispora (strain CBS 962.96) TaxID=1314807 RepID=A0A4S8M4V3_DENBC|nr:hypothetical protein K435DRAFT_797027 [Dendrothele bispora CBS 962.96]
MPPNVNLNSALVPSLLALSPSLLANTRTILSRSHLASSPLSYTRANISNQRTWSNCPPAHQKDARAYASYTLLSWKLASYSGKISAAVIVIDLLAPQSNLCNIANLAKAVIGAQSIPLTAELYVCLAFLLQVAAAIQSKPDHPANNDGTKWWEEIDKGFSDARNKGDAERISKYVLDLISFIRTLIDPLNLAISFVSTLDGKRA